MLSQNADMLNYTHAIPQREPAILTRRAAKRRASRAETKLKAMLFLLLAVVGLLSGIGILQTQQSHDMQRLRSEVIALEKSNERARLDVARLESPARVQAIAETLGMEVPTQAIYGKSDVHVDQTKIKD